LKRNMVISRDIPMYSSQFLPFPSFYPFFFPLSPSPFSFFLHFPTFYPSLLCFSSHIYFFDFPLFNSGTQNFYYPKGALHTASRFGSSQLETPQKHCQHQMCTLFTGLHDAIIAVSLPVYSCFQAMKFGLSRKPEERH
jgi:hypothetical protein